jgi:hypothetical protein
LSAVAVVADLTVVPVVAVVKYAQVLLKQLILDRPRRLPSAPVDKEALGLQGDPQSLTGKQPQSQVQT